MWSGYNQSVETDVVREGHGSIDANQCKLEKNQRLYYKSFSNPTKLLP